MDSITVDEMVVDEMGVDEIGSRGSGNILEGSNMIFHSLTFARSRGKH